mgnify:CR=1 FL=1
MIAKQTPQTHIYVIGIVIVAVLALIKYYKFPQIDWGYFVAGVLGLILIFYYIEYQSKQGKMYVTQEQKGRISSFDAIKYSNQYMYWLGIPLDESSAINVEEREDRAVEDTEKNDTPVFYRHVEHEKTRDVYDMVLKTEYNDTFKFLEEIKIVDWNYFELGITKLTLSYSKNCPYTSRERQIFIRAMIDGMASKSAQSYAYEWDQDTKRYLGRKIVREKDPTESEEKKEDEE